MYSPHSGLPPLHLMLAFFFRRYKIALVFGSLLLFPVGCATTRINHQGPCLKELESGSRLLVPWLPEKNTEFYLNGLRKIHKRQNIEIISVAEKEWDLKAAGITDPLDSSNFPALRESGFTHLLLIQELSNRSESKYVYYTPEELSRENVIYAYKPSWQERGNQSEILLQLVPLNDIKATHSIVAKTVIGHLIVRNLDRGETNLNPTSVESARYKALVKAAKRMLDECDGQ